MLIDWNCPICRYDPSSNLAWSTPKYYQKYRRHTPYSLRRRHTNPEREANQFNRIKCLDIPGEIAFYSVFIFAASVTNKLNINKNAEGGVQKCHKKKWRKLRNQQKQYQWWLWEITKSRKWNWLLSDQWRLLYSSTM